MDGAGGAASFAGVLGVERSVCGRRWRLRRGDGGSGGQTIAERLGLPEIVGRLLAQRGVDLDHAPLFLAPRLRDQLPDPSHLRDMDAAAARLVRAVRDRRNDRRLRRLRCRRRDLGGAADAVFRRGRRAQPDLRARPAARGLRPERARSAAPARRGRRRRRHRRLRHHRASAARRSRPMRARRDRHRPSCRRAAAAARDRARQPEPARRGQPARRARRGRRRLSARRRGQPRAAQGRLVFGRARRARSARLARPRGARHGLRCRAR